MGGHRGKKERPGVNRTGKKGQGTQTSADHDEEPSVLSWVWWENIETYFKKPVRVSGEKTSNGKFMSRLLMEKKKKKRKETQIDFTYKKCQFFLAIENANFNFWWQSSRETDWWECKLVQLLRRPELVDGLDTGRGLRWESETMPRCLAWTVESVMCCLLSWGKWKRTGGEGDRSQCSPPKLKSGCVTLEVPTTQSRGDEHGMGMLGAQGKMCIQNLAAYLCCQKPVSVGPYMLTTYLHTVLTWSRL